ncbi:hypothetical protein DFJ74DRAFT_713740 [Hyaloraphidium curvatum]|nr:hypothetical protein DFJ74DRAFT_713740 [Hyaloraphidium curvatum]
MTSAEPAPAPPAPAGRGLFGSLLGTFAALQMLPPGVADLLQLDAKPAETKPASAAAVRLQAAAAKARAAKAAEADAAEEAEVAKAGDPETKEASEPAPLTAPAPLPAGDGEAAALRAELELARADLHRVRVARESLRMQFDLDHEALLAERDSLAAALQEAQVERGMMEAEMEALRAQLEEAQGREGVSMEEHGRVVAELQAREEADAQRDAALAGVNGILASWAELVHGIDARIAPYASGTITSISERPPSPPSPSLGLLKSFRKSKRAPASPTAATGPAKDDADCALSTSTSGSADDEEGKPLPGVGAAWELLPAAEALARGLRELEERSMKVPYGHVLALGKVGGH